MGDSGVERVKVVTYWNANAGGPAHQAVFDAYKKKHGATSDPYSQAIRMSAEFLAQAMLKAKSTDPTEVGRAMEGMKMEGPFGPVEMRASDHQLIQPLFVATFVKAAGKYRNTADGTTDYAFRVDAKIEGPATARPTTCKMRRP
jgi:branched-chain amino acid transport system substrate-binding protein